MHLQAVMAWNKYRSFTPLCVLGRGSSGVAVLMHDGSLRVVCKRIIIQDMPPNEIAKVENEVYAPFYISFHPLTLPHRSPSCGSSYQHHFTLQVLTVHVPP